MKDVRTSVADVIKNGVGTLLTRGIIIVMPFAFGGAMWAGKTIVELSTEKLILSLERIDKRLDNISRIVEMQGQDIGSLKTSQASQSAKMDGLRDRFDDRRGRNGP